MDSHPLIISASRATDIPAFHGEWFEARLKEGFCSRRNPFNGTVSKVFFDRTRCAVFWSKNPKPFIPRLKAVEERGIVYCFQFTLNDYEPEGLEPGVPPLRERVETFKRLSALIGPERVVWRFDPIILSEKLSPELVAGRIERLAKELSGLSRKIVVSFADIERYANVKRRLSGFREPSESEIETLAGSLSSIGRSFGFEVATCAEAVGLEFYGITRNSCVDAKLFARLAPELAGELSKLKKDKGQRKSCLCFESKDVGEYGLCPHGCLYCYANGRSVTSK